MYSGRTVLLQYRIMSTVFTWLWCTVLEASFCNISTGPCNIFRQELECVTTITVCPAYSYALLVFLNIKRHLAKVFSWRPLPNNIPQQQAWIKGILKATPNKSQHILSHIFQHIPEQPKHVQRIPSSTHIFEATQFSSHNFRIHSQTFL